MAEKKKEKQEIKKNKATYKAALLLGIIAILVLLFAGYSLAYSNKIYPNIFIAGEKVSGLTKTQAKDKIKQKIDTAKLEKVTLTYQDPLDSALGKQEWQINLSDIDFKYNIDKTIDEVWQFGRRQSFKQSIKEQFLALIRKNNQAMVADYNQEKFDAKINEIAQKLDVKEQVISFVLKDNQAQMVSGKDGQKVDKEQTTINFQKAAGIFEDNAQVIVIKTSPKVKADKTGAAKKQFEKMVAGDLVLKWDNQQFKVLPDKIEEWAQFSEKEVTPNEWELVAGLNNDKVKELLKTIAQKVDQEPMDAKLTISDGRAVVFQSSQDGYQLDQDDAVSKISNVLLGNASINREVKLTVKTLKPAIRNDTINNLGINELIGEGSSNFVKSPSNRIHNITVGANMFNGVLIRPGDTFSFNQILGEVSAARGFLPELVIKEDRVIPETGGGLCQVSTTMFRAAIYSGLNITERTAHSFRVRYYEPPVGLDATVYIPKPDLKFVNDTPGYILIQTKLGNNGLTFQFYGTKDGRTVDIKGPFTSNPISPGPTVYIDDPSLPEGELQVLERAVAGLTATVNWTVYKDGKVLHQKTFVSKYVAWPSQYKRGTGPAAEQPPAEQPQ